MTEAPKLSPDEHERLQRAGANARAAGRSFLDNPHLKSENCPAATGEPLEVWVAKHDAWELGWRAEDAMRG